MQFSGQNNKLVKFLVKHNTLQKTLIWKLVLKCTVKSMCSQQVNIGFCECVGEKLQVYLNENCDDAGLMMNIETNDENCDNLGEIVKMVTHDENCENLG